LTVSGAFFTGGSPIATRLRTGRSNSSGQAMTSCLCAVSTDPNIPQLATAKIAKAELRPGAA
jgi:hypothetical protein